MDVKHYFIIGDDGTEYGPYSVHELREFVGQGRLNQESQIKEDDMLGEWQPLGDIVPDATPEDFEDLKKTLSDSSHRLQTGTAFGEAWDSFTSNYLLILGALIVYFVILGGVSGIPAVGSIIQVLIQGALTGGLFILMLNMLRNEPAKIGDMFEGFRRAFGPLCVLSVIQSVVSFMLIIPGLILFLVGLLPKLENLGGAPEDEVFSIWISAFVNPLTIGGFVAMIIPSSIFFGLFYWTIPLVADKGFGVIQSISLSFKIAFRNFFRLILFYVVVIIISIIAMIPVGLGLIVAFPLIFLAMANCYEQMFCLKYNE